MQKVADQYLLHRQDIGNMVRGYLRSPSTPVAVDVETTGFDPRTKKLVSIQFKQFGKPACILGVRYFSDKELEILGVELKPLFDKALVVGMNFKFDWQWFKIKLGVSIKRVYDVMLAEQVIRGLGLSDAHKQGVSFNLQAIAETYHIGVSKEERNIFPDMDLHPELWNSAFSHATLRYMAQDVDVLEHIYHEQQTLIEERGLSLTVAIENSCLPAIADMEVNGIRVDVTAWRLFMKQKEQQAASLESQLIQSFGEIIASSRRTKFQQDRKVREEYEKSRDAYVAYLKEKHAEYVASGGTDPFTRDLRQVFQVKRKEGSGLLGWGDYKQRKMAEWREQNPNPGVPKLDESPMKLSSPAQVLEALQKLGVTIEKTEWNKDLRKLLTFEAIIDSTDSKILDQLPEGKWPEVDMFRAWRKLYKFNTSFGETLLSKINPVTLRIHPNYVQIGASTGRMSCQNPNWQQIPSKGDGKKLRSLIQARLGRLLLTADFSNIELRILADMSKDENMLRFFAEGQDLHCETARMMFNLPKGLTIEELKELKSPQGFKYRDAAKTINFGLVYGMSANRLASQLKITKQEAEKLMQAYFKLYPGIAAWLAEQAENGVRTCKSRTLAGRLRLYRLPAPEDPDYRRLRGSVERKAKNTPIQGTSADITKLALAYFYERAPEYLKLVACVHDEIVIEAEKKHVAEGKRILGQAMDDACAYFLKTVALPPTVVNASEAWEKAA